MRVYPKSYTTGLPSYLAPVAHLPSSSEADAAARIRAAFLLDGDPAPYMTDVIRAMRLLSGRHRYVEVGTYDKGCLAYCSTLLARDALLVDVDVDARPDQTAKLQRFIQPGQTLVTVLGDSTAPSTLARVAEAVGREGADCIFIDANHSAAFAWADYANFSNLLADAGVMLFHDVYWQGDGTCIGASTAMEWIDRLDPVHVVFTDHPVHRFFPWFVKDVVVWGGVGILRR